MRLTKLWVKNAAGLKDHVIEIPPTGFTLFQAENESGKSTLARVPDILIGFKFGSKDTKLESLRNILESSKPLVLGMEYWIGQNHYSIEKSYLSESKALFQQLEPNFRSEVNSAAEAAFQETLQTVDLDLLRILNVAQAQNLDIHEKKLGDGPSIARLLELAAGPVLSDSKLGIANLIEKARQDYFTASGRPTTSANTRGSEILTKQRKLSDLNAEISVIRRRQSDIEQLALNSGFFDDADTVQYMFQAQQFAPRLAFLESQLNDISQLDSDLASTAIKPSDLWTENIHSTLSQTRDAYIAFHASGKIKLTALRNLSLDISGQTKELEANENQEFSTLINESILIPNVIQIEISNPGEDQSIKEGAAIHESNLKHLGINDFAESEKMEKYTLLASQRARVLEQAGGLEKLNEDIEEIRKFRSINPAKWSEALKTKPIPIELLNEAKNLEFRVTQLQKDEDNIKLEELELQLQDLNHELDSLQLERDAIDYLFKTMDRKRGETKKQLAPIFKQKFDQVCSAIFQDQFSFSVGPDLRITSRKQNDLPLGVERLSVGAKETLGLIIRLTICNLAGLESPLPLILDDDFAYVDRPTSLKITNYIGSMVNQQVVLFTHQPEKFPHLKARSL